MLLQENQHKKRLAVLTFIWCDS